MCMASTDDKRLNKKQVLEIRKYLVDNLISKSISNVDIANIFNVHPSQITRIKTKL